MFISVSILLDADAIAGITMQGRGSVSVSACSLILFLDCYRMSMSLRASAFNSIDTLMNAEAPAIFAPAGPTGRLLGACSYRKLLRLQPKRQ